jgi:thiol-disulfide isomerase/thioredoxin
MKYRLILFLILFSIEATLVSQSITKPSDEKPTPEILVGEYLRADLQKGDFGKYFMEEYTRYNPKKEIVDELKKYIYDKTITIVLATWCHDSKEQVPRFFCILDLIDYNTNRLKIICVDRNKLAGQMDISELKIERVPTFIIYHDGAETGRIIETPNISLEQDILNFLRD